jgi:hypothetical protein
MLAEESRVYAMEEGGDGQKEPSASTPPPAETPAPPTEGSVTVTPVYSEGLKFRSNGDGTCALAGMGSCTASCLLIPPKSPAGDTVTEILPYALKGSIVGAIEIPATVKTLSAASFAGCPRLSLIRVAAGSEFFTEQDGVLYTKSGGALIYCPAGLSVPVLTLHGSLRRIHAGAFAECTGLQGVSFRGTTAEWHGVIVGDDNAPLFAAKLQFVS